MTRSPRPVRRLVALVTALLVTAPLTAGVVFEVETTDHYGPAPSSQTLEAAVEGSNIRMAVASSTGGEPGSVIFRGERRELVVIDHDSQTFHLMDKAAIEQLAGTLGLVNTQMQEMLKNVPEDRRAMVEQMMQQQLPEAQGAPEATQLRRTGESADKHGYPCVQYVVVQGARTIRELWVTEWRNIDGGPEVVEVFEDMASFFEELMTAIPDAAGQSGPQVNGSFFEHLRALEGFPVVTYEFGSDGELRSEATLKSSSRRTLDPADFEPPAGYKRFQMFSQ